MEFDIKEFIENKIGLEFFYNEISPFGTHTYIRSCYVSKSNLYDNNLQIKMIRKESAENDKYYLYVYLRNITKDVSLFFGNAPKSESEAITLFNLLMPPPPFSLN